MVRPGEGNANLWIENLNIRNTQDKNFIQFRGSDNTLNFKGTNNIQSDYDGTTQRAIIHVSQGLTIEGGTDGTGILNFTSSNSLWGTFIGGNYSQVLPNTDITINSGNFNTSARNIGAALIGSAYAGSIGDIIVHGGTFIDTYQKARLIDCFIGGGGDVGNITIENATIISEKVSDPIIGITGGQSKMGNITITNSYVSCKGINEYATAIGPSDYGNYRSTSGSITINKCILDIEVAGGGAGIGTGIGCTVNGDIKIINTDLNKVIVTGGGEQVGKGVNGTVTGKVIIDNSATDDDKDDSDNSGGHWESYAEIIQTKKDPLKIHHGTKANQATNFYINDMHTKSLGVKDLVDSAGNFLVESDADRYYALSYDKDKQAAWLETVKLAQNKNLDDISVTTKQNANVAIRVLDGAIEYALNESTYMGAYLQRLEYTDVNITTMGENVQSAESVIRDADMAKEMTEYTKYNVITQAAQSMLAQANQNLSQVLSLLR